MFPRKSSDGTSISTPGAICASRRDGGTWQPTSPLLPGVRRGDLPRHGPAATNPPPSATATTPTTRLPAICAELSRLLQSCERPSGTIDVVPGGYLDIHRLELAVIAALADGDRHSVTHQLRRIIVDLDTTHHLHEDLHRWTEEQMQTEPDGWTNRRFDL